MWTTLQSWMNLLPVFSNAWSSLCVMIQFNHPKQRPVLWNVSSVFCTVYHESCASEPDLEFHHVNCVTTLLYVLWHKPTNITWTTQLNFAMKLMYVLWTNPQISLDLLIWTLLRNWCICALTQTLKLHLNFKFHCSLCLNLFTYLPERQI